MSHSDDVPAPRLRRSLIGVSPAAAEQAFDDLEQEHAANMRTVKAEIAREQAECGRLQVEIERLQERLDTARNAVNVLRSKLAQERAAKAVLVARLMDQTAISDQADARAASETPFDEIRLNAESQREAEALRDLVEQLYRTAYAHGAMPPGLEVTLPPPPAAAAPETAPGETAGQQEPELEPVKPAGADRQRWHSFLLGKVVGKTLRLPDGTIIAREGEPITPAIIQAADAAGLLFELILPMRLTRVDQEP